jgi:hypothetical protein
MSLNSTNSWLNGGTSSGEKVISIDDDMSQEMIADVINKCVENEHIDDDSKIIIFNVLPCVHFHNDTIIIPKLKRY